jgi:hypothetical protein
MTVRRWLRSGRRLPAGGDEDPGLVGRGSGIARILSVSDQCHLKKIARFANAPAEPFRTADQGNSLYYKLQPQRSRIYSTRMNRGSREAARPFFGVKSLPLERGIQLRVRIGAISEPRPTEAGPNPLRRWSLLLPRGCVRAKRLGED